MLTAKSKALKKAVDSFGKGKVIFKSKGFDKAEADFNRKHNR